MSRLFSAKWPGRCDSCGEQINEGDDIGFVDGRSRPVCEDCWEFEGGDDDDWV